MAIYSGFSHWKWWFSIVMGQFTGGYPVFGWLFSMGEYGWIWMNGGEEDSLGFMMIYERCASWLGSQQNWNRTSAHHFPAAPWEVWGIPAVFNRRWSAVPGSTNVWLPVQHNWSIGWYVHGHKGDDVFLAISGLLIAHRVQQFNWLT